jgi:glycosyltransferase involved in cell wall biosynthesis/ubiquinone/menaquinone biosynthesis C-methylase UbiE
VTRVAIVHDYLTQRGGAERVVLSMLRAFPRAPLYTSLYRPETTFPEFAAADVRTLPLNRVPPLRRYHRLALPLLAPAFSRLEVRADVVLCSSSGWAHGARVPGRKVVYCYTPARWLYQRERYLGDQSPRGAVAALAALRPHLTRWDRRAAASADRYLTLSTAVSERIRALYGRDAEILPPPLTIDPDALAKPVEGLAPGFFLCVSRLLPYKDVAEVCEAFSMLPDERLAVAGDGPDASRLRARAPANVRLLGSVTDAQLRWLYANCAGLLSASYEDYGLTPLEAAAFGKPAAVLRWGGFLDTVREGSTGVFFDVPEPEEIRRAPAVLRSREWDAQAIRAHAESYSESRFVERLRQVVAEEAAAGRRARRHVDESVLRREQAFHDSLARRLDQAATTPAQPDDLDRALFRRLGPLDGCRVLELGCGSGDLTLQLLERRAEVVAVDLSSEMLDIARRRAARFVPNASLELVAAPVEATTLPDESFDLVVGKWILHHVDVGQAAAEVARVLRPRGVGLFIENSGRNLLLRLAREHLAGRFGIPRFGTKDEHPLVERDYQLLRERFARIELLYPDFFFFTLLDRQILRHRWRGPSRAISAMDRALGRRLPWVRRYSFHVLVELEKVTAARANSSSRLLSSRR